MSNQLINETISALNELITVTLNEKSLKASTELSKEISNKVLDLYNLSRRGVLLQEFATFFKKIVGTCTNAAESFDYLEMTFEVGPQYNDEGFDLRITYDSEITCEFLQGQEANCNTDIGDMFHDWIHGSLEPEDFEGWFNRPVSLDYHNTMTLYIANPKSLFNLLEKSPDPSFEEFSKHLNIQCSSKRAQTY